MDDYIKKILGSLAALATIFITALVSRKRSTADIDKTKAESLKINAETSKTFAEVAEIKAKTDISIADAAMKITVRLGLECDSLKAENKLLEDEIEVCHELTHRLRNEKSRLEIDKEHLTEKLAALQQTLNLEYEVSRSLKIEIKKLRDG